MPMNRALRGLATGALLLALGLTAPRASAGPVQIRSGLPWASGVVVQQPGFEAWRGRLLDVRTTYFARPDWPGLTASARQTMRWVARASGPRHVIGLAMLPNANRGQLDACADGGFDTEIQGVVDAILAGGGQALADAGRPAILRLGWEANLSRGHPWIATGDGTSYAACFRHWGDRLNPPGQPRRFLIDWNMSEQGTPARRVESLWPGDGYVDVAGIDTYDRCPQVPEGDEAAWNRRVNRVDRKGNPAGLLSWFRWVQARGKPFSVPEWGVSGPRHVCTSQVNGSGGDSPWWVGKMHGFFAANAGAIAYEAYFNGHGGTDGSNGSHAIFRPDPAFPPPTDPGYLDYVQRFNPLTATEYRRLWSAGPQPEPQP